MEQTKKKTIKPNKHCFFLFIHQHGCFRQQKIFFQQNKKHFLFMATLAISQLNFASTDSLFSFWATAHIGLTWQVLLLHGLQIVIPLLALPHPHLLKLFTQIMLLTIMVTAWFSFFLAFCLFRETKNTSKKILWTFVFMVLVFWSADRKKKVTEFFGTRGSFFGTTIACGKTSYKKLTCHEVF